MALTALQMAQLGADRYGRPTSDTTFKALFWRYLNTAGREIVSSANWWWLHQEANHTFTVDVKDYTLTGILGVDYLINKAGNRMHCIPEHLYQIHFRNSSEASGEPTIWALTGRDATPTPLMSIWPAPNAANAGTGKIGKLIAYTDLAADGNVSIIPAQFHEVQVDWALAVLAAAQKDDAFPIYDELRKAGLNSMLQENAAHTGGLGP